MAKDRARPFSKKHRRYWIPITGGMIAMGIINVALGMCSYKSEEPHERMQLTIPKPHDAPPAPADAAGTMAASQLPADVMRALAVKYPRTIPAAASVAGDVYTIEFPPNAPHKHARFKADGTFVSED